MKFLAEGERLIGEFSVKMCQASSEYFIQSLNKLISLLIESVEEMKKAWLNKYKFKDSKYYEDLDISLITFKIGDLMRCKCVSNEAEIIRILKVVKQMSERCDTNLIKIIRVKDRLETGTRDILINFMFDGIIPCEMQLAVDDQIS